MFENEIANDIPILLAISTCPRCTRMKEFLDEYEIEAKIVDVDLLSFTEKRNAYKFLQAYNPRLSFPTLIYKGSAVIGEDYDGAKEVLGL